MAEADRHSDKKESLITLSEGTRAYLVPEFGFFSKEGGNFRPATLSEFQNGLDSFFSEIEQQGGQIIAILKKKVDLDRDIFQKGKLVQYRGNTREMTFVVVKK